jgi:quercetin dioxygenase-like cupin family protein
MILTTQQSKLVDLENHIKAMPQVDLKVEHFNIRGVYVRSLFIPAGHVLTGAIHNHECINIVAMGDISVTDGDNETRLKAGFISVSKAGTKRAGYAHEDTVFITVHRTDLTDIAEIENDLVSKDYDTYFNRLEVIQ